ncbi:arylesterase [Pseudochrobactrum sp. sp1633]|uniref:arylesterase n=1 Tax=Pseudochrobactrum sp. sp1633 TaxID=3036706 RepID=UPI0025A5B87D|nr:arylesterase [Pseudochrobactrum sp. sp1633]MDM8344243.1 arylesterase [Pseudochrobactrum sp. sp1633]HWD14624.1 arylesterase [Pseudochrobactrum sp.]
MSLRFAHLTAIALLFGLSVSVASPVSAQEASADTVQIVGFGDSLMAGYQLAQSDGFTAQLQSALQNAGYKASVANAGVSGDTTSGGLARLDWSVPDETQLVILELGANDALRGISPELSEKNLDQMLARLKERGIPVLLAGMIAPPNMGADYAAGFNPIYQTLADKYQIKLYPFFLDGVAADKKLLLDDGMHPNPQGVKVMVANILPAVKAMLDQESIDLN